MSKLEYTVLQSTVQADQSNVYPNRPINIHSENVAVVEVDRRILGKQRTSLADFHVNVNLLQHTKCRQFPVPMIRLIYMLQRCVFDCELLEPEASGPDGEETDEPTTEEEGADKKKKAKPPAPKPSFSAGKGKKKPLQKCTFELNGETHARVEQYVQTVRAPDGTALGWRIWYIGVDPNFNMDKAIMSQLFWSSVPTPANIRSRMTVQAETTDQLIVRDQAYWVKDVVGRYPMNQSIRQQFKVDNPYRESTIPLHDPRNGASCSKLFAPMNVLQESIFAGRAAPKYLSVTMHEEEDCIRFPGGAVFIAHHERQPDFFHHVILTENALTRASISRMEPIYQSFLIAQKHEQTKRERRLRSGDGDVLRQVKEANELELAEIESRMTELETQIREGEQLDPQQLKALEKALRKEKVVVAKEKAEWRKKGETIERLKVLFTSGDALPPGYGAPVKWMVDKMTHSETGEKKTKFSAMRTLHKPLDPTLNTLSSFLARDMWLFEDVLGIATMQEELLMLMIMRFNAFDSRRDRLKNNMVFLGPHSAGKSVILNTARKMSVPGWGRAITYETSKAYATNVVFDYLGFFHDELNERYFADDDNEGSSLIKTMLTEKIISTNTIDPETRETKHFDAYVDIQMFANSNAVKGKFPAPLASRFLLIPCARYIRNGHDMSLKDAEQQMVIRDHGQYAATQEEFQLIHCLGAMVYMLITVSYFPPIDMRCAMLVLSDFSERMLKKFNIPIEPRFKTQIENGVESTCVYEATRRVFCTEEVFPKDKEFEFEDLLKVLPYLYATEHQVLFTLTQLRNQVVDPARQDVVKALVAMCTTDSKELKFPLTVRKPGAQEGAALEPDFNYLFIPIQGTALEADQFISRLAHKVTQKVLSDTKVVMHKSIVKEQLQILMSEQNSYERSYSNAGEPVDVPIENLPTLKVVTSTPTGVAVSRQFLADYKHMSVDEVRIIIQQMTNSHTPKRRLITGIVYRSKEQMYPYLLQMLQQTPNPNEPVVVRNLAYRKPGYGECVNGQERKNEHDSSYIELDRSVENYFYEHFLDEHQITDRPPNFPEDLDRVPEPNQRSYPDSYIKDAIQIVERKHHVIKVPLKRNSEYDMEVEGKVDEEAPPPPPPQPQPQPRPVDDEAAMLEYLKMMGISEEGF